MEWISRICLCAGLVVAAAQDLRTKTISVVNLGIMAMSGFLIALGQCLAEEDGWLLLAALAGMLPGGVLFGVGRMTNEAIGEGDALLFMAAGLYLGVIQTLELIWLSGFFAMVFGSILIIKKKENRKTKIAMAPFVLVAQLVLWAGGVWE